MEKNLLVVLGPTACGKTALGVRLARALGGEILSADSRQVYRGLDIGSGKDLAEYQSGGEPVRYHLIDIADPNDEFSVFDFQRHCALAFASVLARGRLPLLVGGSGLYLESVLAGYRMVEAPENPALRRELGALSSEELEARLRALKPQLHNRTDLESRERTIRAIEILEHERSGPPPPAAMPEIHPVLLGVRFPRDELRQRIRDRLRTRLEGGLIPEVERLLQEGVSRGRLIALGLEYRFVVQRLEGQIRNRNDLLQKLSAAIGLFAKRQETWFRRMERAGHVIHWIDRGDFDAALQVVGRYAWLWR